MAANDLSEEHRAKLKAALEEGGAPRVVAYIQSNGDADLRRTLYALARRAFPERDQEGRRFDDLIFIARAGVHEALRQAAIARAKLDHELATDCTDAANKISYNLSADLADCWPGDETPRERRHLEAGFRAACDCIVWRQELGKPPDRRAMAYWAAGMHQLSLGNAVEALGWFETAAGLAAKAVAAQAEAAASAADSANGTPARAAESGARAETSAHQDGGLNAADYVKPGGDFGLILYHGYAGLARHVLGSPEGIHQFKRACLSFQGTINNFKEAEMIEDAKFGLEQLRWVERKLTGKEST